MAEQRVFKLKEDGLAGGGIFSGRLMRQECYLGLYTSHSSVSTWESFPNGKETPLKVSGTDWSIAEIHVNGNILYIWEDPGWEISLDLCKRGDTLHELSQVAAALWSKRKFLSKGICLGISVWLWQGAHHIFYKFAFFAGSAISIPNREKRFISPKKLKKKKKKRVAKFKMATLKSQ